MNLSSILIGSEDPTRLADFYSRLFGEPGWSQGGYTGWQLGTGTLMVGPHDQVKGQNAQPGRLLWNLECSDVPGEFARLSAAGATVVQAPYNPMENPPEGTETPPAMIATFADPDGNYFQIASPM